MPRLEGSMSDDLCGDSGLRDSTGGNDRGWVKLVDGDIREMGFS